MIRFHLDESAHGRVAAGLQRRGIDVTTSVDAGLMSASDDQQLAFAHSQSRVLITNDSDFLYLHQSGTPHSGIAFITSGQRTVGEIVRLLCLMHDCLNAEDMRGRVEYL